MGLDVNFIIGKKNYGDLFIHDVPKWPDTL